MGINHDQDFVLIEPEGTALLTTGTIAIMANLPTLYQEP